MIKRSAASAAAAAVASASSLRPPFFTQIQHHNQQYVNDLISSLCKQYRFRDALGAFYSLPPHLHLFPSTYATLFLACSDLRSLADVRRLHRHLVASPCLPDTILHNHILNAYGKCGAPDDARRLFDEMPNRNRVSWTSIISGCSQNSRDLDAVVLYLGMLRSGLHPDHFALGNVVRACSGLADVELGRQLHCHAVKSNCGGDKLVQNALVTMYARLDRIDDATLVFESIKEKDPVSWGSMIAAFAQQGYEMEALHLFREMICSGIHYPNEFHFGSAFSACGNIKNLQYGEQMHGICYKFGYERNEFAGSSLSEMYAQCGLLDRTKKVFNEIKMPDLVSWNSILSACSSLGLSDEAFQLFSEMRDIGVEPDDITIRCLLCACTDCDSLLKGEMIHSHAVKLGWDENIAVLNSLLMMHSKCAGLSTAIKLFEEMKDRDRVSWNTILSACLQHQQSKEVFSFINLMQNSEFKFDQITLNAILNACADLAYLDMGSQVHAYALKVGLEFDTMVRNAIIDTYAKCGSLEDARKLFDLVGDRNDVFSWSSLILGYAQYGHAKESLELFWHMQSLGLKPNHVTYVSVLTACSHVGLIDQGLRYFNMMEIVHGIEPTKEHCSCVIDMLARAGRLNDAEKFINQMPFKPDVIMWKTILAACRIHGNAEIGRNAAESILRIDPQNSGAYALLCSIYSSSGSWDDVARLRKVMKSNSVKKLPGKSWIKLKGDVHSFIAEDTSHQQSEGIYEMLELLGLEMVDYNFDLGQLYLHD
ncbi:pentatricopeptide repeat-containing protein At3g53360, mitochondrial-like [Zingiber officinale]|uniref:Pentatricopeptide repeat-containing protein n=1 Tax=Zingiber officinale TaxID=94328 RepID=A0A8J5HDB2_ZINOF|nr:pentatricopeptide repeat-containing protein At3g53360, mitochondrial-like [Zingiber officinale]XP_042373394.1 pentatricopeptide repeat-containing protein At3g53360, mitochondrial-like [Zingiber officinale]XP_042373395.1 pentatricopeptide repeat-containing protein At3g53360, mitochondrial-like [Zingiber officinale]XP_042373396.1 pentatricopeptide repeat-containing protein At3g53360, mitochondrial-like [Zingiber officinale]KAG6519127.1 hypothetical protein ZIOFF_022616 [Zingiber officinale]